MIDLTFTFVRVLFIYREEVVFDRRSFFICFQTPLPRLVGGNFNFLDFSILNIFNN